MVRLDHNPPSTNLQPANPLSVSEEVEEVGIKLSPTNLYSDEPPLETDFHRRQIDLLIRLLEFWWRDRPDFYVSGKGFHLVGGRYEAIAPTDAGWLWSDQLDLFLGVHER